ncbi:hypothetical protein [Streptomyces bicolor]|uniref:hypothetical protein n=1 Tax=Streptomyces bicolor TaxID=66874 RepID=UPI000AC4E70B|nr:hypothetical protein [Streptomyces bicolor]
MAEAGVAHRQPFRGAPTPACRAPGAENPEYFYASINISGATIETDGQVIDFTL